MARCADKSSIIDFSPIDPTKPVMVGGYGVTQLHGRWWIPQPKRHMGPNYVSRVDGDIIYVGGGIVEDDGKTVRNSRNCMPSGQDSGSALFQEGKVRGILFRSLQIGNSDHTTDVIDHQYVNLGTRL
ncbi:MAG: hypothetical protein HC883_03825 [Bdellovibrionaceae bacterium]|nr:hypothetical protein [Pseudobdellovibrionaceae bacterium]